MPVCEVDPWRLQYFDGIACPDGVNIPTEDADAYRWYPQFRWVYNKLAIAESQDVPCGLHGVAPAAYPVFSKPIYNLRGMGIDARKLRSAVEYRRHQRPGHMWMALFEGEHISTDAAVVDGKVVWLRHATAVPLGRGVFDYWVVEARRRPGLEASCRRWVARHLGGYTGMINLETIGGRIIEVHLRFSDQWPDLYGPGWVEALIRLYATKRWRFSDRRREGYSVVLFGRHGRRYLHPPAEIVARIRRRSGVSSVQITFHEDRPPTEHAMPPGGFRLAIVNGWSLAAGRRARRALAKAFGMNGR